VSGYLRKEGLLDISHDTIYVHIWRDKEAVEARNRSLGDGYGHGRPRQVDRISGQPEIYMSCITSRAASRVAEWSKKPLG
jgi:hypothetical protein